MITYEEYLKKTGQKDCKTAYKWWWIEEYGLTEKEAIRKVYNIYVNREKPAV